MASRVPEEDHVKLRIALTISGAVALGAYEGGVLAALLTAVRGLSQGNDPLVRIDAMGGASAGSITALLGARCLAEGIDPIHVMREVWVERSSIKALRSKNADAPLSVEALRGMAIELLDPPGHRVEERQSLPIKVDMALACLRGLEYRIPTLTSRTAVQATTYLDWSPQFPIEPGQKPEELNDAVDYALASGANALAFPPRLIERSPSDYEDVLNFPASNQFWYTDGGTLDNEPLGRTLDIVNELDRGGQDDFRRLHVLIHPHPTGAPTGDAWADEHARPAWLTTLLRAFEIQREQSIFEDLKQLEKTNSRIEWADKLCHELGGVLASLEGDQAERVRGALVNASRTIEGQPGATGTPRGPGRSGGGGDRRGRGGRDAVPGPRPERRRGGGQGAGGA